jgi:hypothetical protein
MAVKSISVKFNKAGGINQALKAPLGTANDIINFRKHPTEGWLCDRGIEPWWDQSPSFTVSGEIITNVQQALLGEKFDSLFVWTKQSTNQVYIIAEQGGYLYYIWGNKGSSVSTDWRRNVVLLDSNRHIPRANEVGTQFIPFGNRLLIINGVDKPIWFYGDNIIRDYSFLLPTPPIELLPIQPNYLELPTAGELTTGTAFPNFQTVPAGLGDRGQGDTSVYSYRMTFIMDSGSESPMSAPAFVTWTIPSDNNAERRFGIFVNDIPIGPKGCVARRIYRTKNQRLGNQSSAQEGIYYFVKQINDNSSEEFIDIVSDNSLVNQAELSASSTIDSLYHFGATWNNRIWLGGGVTHPVKIIYSEASFPEQFPVFNTFELGNGTGGAITKLYSYYNNLLVFRESSIEVIRTNGGSFSISTVSPNIGTRASDSIQLVPEIGVVFLTNDGFYAISGGLDGGSTISVTKISSVIANEVARISTASICRATSTYSTKEKEYWCHYPEKGSKIPTRGAVLHTDDATWSLRHAEVKSKANRFAFTAMATDPDGNILLGTRPRWRTLLGGVSNPLTNGARGTLVGLHVWSGANYWGNTLVASFASQIWTYTATKIALPQNIWESGWIDFGDNSIKHRVFSLDVEILSFGDNSIDLDWGQDYDSAWNVAPTQKPAKSETLFTLFEDAVFGPATPSVTKVPFTIGKSAIKDYRIIRVRWDVVTSLVDNFRFRLKSTYPMHLLSFNINYDSNDQLPLNQKARGNSGQPY